MELYNKEMIKAILDCYDELEENFDLIEYKTDIDHALESVLITNRMREYIALKFNLKFNIMQIMNIMKLNIPDLLDLEDEIFEVLEALLNGYQSEYETFDEGIAVDMKTYLMMIEIMHVNPLKNAGDRVRKSVLEYLAYEENDEKAKAALGLLKDSKGKWLENDNELKIYWNQVDNINEHELEPKNASSDHFYNEQLKNEVMFVKDKNALASKIIVRRW